MVDSEEDYLDTRVVQILSKYLNRVIVFKAKFIYEYANNVPLNSMLFHMYNMVKLDLAGCELVHNVDFLQIIYKLQELNLSQCSAMTTSSLLRYIPTVTTLHEFICRGNGVRVSAFTIFRCVRDLPELQTLDICDSGVMRPYLAHKIYWYSPCLTKFHFTTIWNWDTDVTKMSWFVLVKRKYPDINFTEEVKSKVRKFMNDCRYVQESIRLDEWADESNEVNPL